MRIRDLDQDDATETDRLFALRRAVHAADTPDNPPPLREDYLAQLRHPAPEFRVDWLVAVADAELAGSAALGLPQHDNRHLSVTEIEVRPTHRRRGIGRALLAEVTRRARDAGRRSLIAAATGPVPGGPARGLAGERFLTASGFSPALVSKRRRLDLTTVDEAAEQRLRDECLRHATGYEWVGWTGLTPDALAGGVAALTNRLNVDAPSGDLDLDASTLDAERLHEEERTAIARGRTPLGVAARHRATGEVAAITLLQVRSAGDHASVTLTIAAPEHRGHRLGTIVKVEIQRLARREFPRLRYIQTGNADENAQMVAINERLGFVPYETGTNYLLTL